MLRALVLGIGEADQDPSVVILVLTGSGSRAFCSGGDVAHYAEAFAGRPEPVAPESSAARNSLSPLLVGIEAATNAFTVDGPWSAYKAMRLGMLTDVVPVLPVDNELQRNPLVQSDHYLLAGRLVYGEGLSGEALAAGKQTLGRGEVDLVPPDVRVEKQMDRDRYWGTMFLGRSLKLNRPLSDALELKISGII